MKLYTLCSCQNATHPEDGFWCAVWADSPLDAAVMAQVEFAKEIGGVHAMYVNSSHDLPGDRPPKPGVENDFAVLRKVGWRMEGDASCDTCGLYELDGEFPVCEGCGQCADCGCLCSYYEQKARGAMASRGEGEG